MVLQLDTPKRPERIITPSRVEGEGKGETLGCCGNDVWESLPAGVSRRAQGYHHH